LWWVDFAHNLSGVTEFHYGDCIGVDEQAFRIAFEAGLGVFHCHPATMNETWDAKYRARTDRDFGDLIVLHEPLHPLARNKVMVDRCDLLVAFPAPGGSRGTQFTIDYARNTGKPVVEVRA
jgi:hypothetical protein